MPAIDSVFIANRGEIAVRIIQTLRDMSIRALGCYTPPDHDAMHRKMLDLALPIESYLDGKTLIELALEHGAQAIHPGYGFLSENAQFCAQCQAAGLIFIGPDPEAIEAMGDKLIAKERMAAAGLPLIPSWSGEGSELVEGARSVGYPLLVKAAAGGGGKGMRRVDREEDLEEAVERAQGEALKAFGDDRYFLEKLVERPRHIEVQIFGDRHGNAVCFGERECSLQRRYQKILEEAPSIAVDDELRAQLVAAGVGAVKALNYSGAGTVEFILDESGKFYFLEVNTRLQVEHPVTELVYGIDLVAWQIRVAQGEPLSLAEDFLKPRGWAIEARIYAEDPDRNFMPSVGKLAVFRPPTGPGLRLDTGFREGDEVSTFFDPMLAKLIAYGSDREAARQKLLQALKDFPILGVTTNIPYLTRILAHQVFKEGSFHTQFLEQNSELFAPQKTDQLADLAAILSQLKSAEAKVTSKTDSSTRDNRAPWSDLNAWRSN